MQYNPASFIQTSRSSRCEKLVKLSSLSWPCLFVLSACGTGTDAPARAVEDYLTALVNKDVDRLSALSCADWESTALLEFDSLQAVETRLEGMTCASTDNGDGSYAVVCQGKMIATYDNEDSDFDLAVRTYRVVDQGGDYLVCGNQ